MNKITTILIIALCAVININAQTPCVNGMAGDYPCDGYDLQGHLTLAEMGIPSDGNDCWGWTDPLDGKEYAIMGGINRIVFVDITDPTDLIFVGWMPSATQFSIWRDVKVYNNYAFAVSEADDHGMQVFDLTRLRDVNSPPDMFDEDAYFDNFGSCHNIAMNEETGYAYPVGTGLFSGGPVFVNVQDPLNPVLEGGYDGDGYTHDAQIIIYDGPDSEHQCQEIFFGFNADALTIVDVTDKSDPIQLSRTEYEQTGYTHQGWLNEDRTLLYMNDETDEIGFDFNTRTLIMDVSDLDNPVLVQEYYGETAAIDHNLYVNGDKVFEANYNAGLRVLQMTDVPGEMLDEVGFFDINPTSNSTGFSGAWSVYPYFESGNIVVSGIDQGLFVVSSSTIVANDVDPLLADCNSPDGIRDIESPKFSIYPVPASTEINLSMEEDKQITEWFVRDVTGRILLSEKNEYGVMRNLTINISSLSAGTYFVSINNIPVSQKFIVE